MDGEIVFRVHAVRRMFERGIFPEDVQYVLKTGDTVEQYPDDTPYPSRLVLGWRGSRPIHVVVADNQEFNELVVITVYEPNPARWEPDFKRRKRP